MHEYNLFFLAWFFAGLVNNITGFGAAMVAMPFIANLVPLETAVPASTLIVLTLNLQMAWKYLGHVKWRRLRYLFIGGVVGAATGVLLHQAAGNSVLKLGMGLFLIAYAIYSLSAQGNRLGRLGPGWGLGAGFASTVLGALFGFNGPPLAIYVFKSGWAQEEAKGVLGACFLMTGTTILAGQLLAGLHSAQTVAGYAAGCPGALLGGALGLFVSRYFSQTVYRKAVLLLVLASGMHIAVSSL
jgi:uncharacterized membrane protein YfcA